jgi:hypothetical protein
MQVAVTRDSINDFQQRFQGVWGWYTADNKRLLVRVDTVDADGVSFSDINGHTYRAYVDKGVTFEFIPVRRGFYMGVDNVLYWLSRKPQRQYKRGITTDNTYFYKYSDVLGWQDARMFDVMFHVFQQDAVEAFTRVSKDFALTQDGKVWFNTLLIGTHKGVDVKLTEPLVVQELSGALKRSSIEAHKVMRVSV